MQTQEVQLTAADRCDACGAPAQIVATLPTGSSLLFCGHHGRANALGLQRAGAVLADSSGQLTTAV